MNQPSSPGAVVVDANVLVSICSKEPTHLMAENALADYAANNWTFYAPGVIVGEVLFVLCRKLENGLLTEAAHGKAIEIFQDHMSVILPPPGGEAPLISRAEEVRSGYGCSRSADGLYVALTEELMKTGAAEFLTFDKDVVNQIGKNAPTVKVNLLPA
jgi:predicted nucleic acid-binding protein